MNKIRTAAYLCGTLLITACGGGGDSEQPSPPPPPEPPAPVANTPVISQVSVDNNAILVGESAELTFSYAHAQQCELSFEGKTIELFSGSEQSGEVSQPLPAAVITGTGQVLEVSCSNSDKSAAEQIQYSVRAPEPKLWDLSLSRQQVIIGEPLDIAFQYQDVHRCELSIEDKVVPLFEGELQSGKYAYQLNGTVRSGSSLTVTVNCAGEDKLLSQKMDYQVLSKVFYTSSSAESGEELWMADELGNKTKMNVDLSVIVPNSIRFVGNGFFYVTEKDFQRSVWYSDGSTAGTKMLLQDAGYNRVITDIEFFNSYSEFIIELEGFDGEGDIFFPRNIERYYARQVGEKWELSEFGTNPFKFYSWNDTLLFFDNGNDLWRIKGSKSEPELLVRDVHRDYAIAGQYLLYFKCKSLSENRCSLDNAEMHLFDGKNTQELSLDLQTTGVFPNIAFVGDINKSTDVSAIKMALMKEGGNEILLIGEEQELDWYMQGYRVYFDETHLVHEAVPSGKITKLKAVSVFEKEKAQFFSFNKTGATHLDLITDEGYREAWLLTPEKQLLVNSEPLAWRLRLECGYSFGYEGRYYCVGVGASSKPYLNRAPIWELIDRKLSKVEDENIWYPLDTSRHWFYGDNEGYSSEYEHGINKSYVNEGLGEKSRFILKEVLSGSEIVIEGPDKKVTSFTVIK